LVAGGVPPAIVCTAAEASLPRFANRVETTPDGVSFDVRLSPGDRAHRVIIYR
jgi:hypothetical protein